MAPCPRDAVVARRGGLAAWGLCAAFTLGTACAHAGTPAASAGAHVPACTAGQHVFCGSAAADYAAVVHAGWTGVVGGALVPMYLPTWTPSAQNTPVGVCPGRSYDASQAYSYVAKLWLAHCSRTTPVPSAADIVAEWVVRGGTAQALGPSPLASAAGRHGQPAAGGMTFYAGTAAAPAALLQWQRAGWEYQVVDAAHTTGGAAALVHYAKGMRSAMGRAASPVPGVSAGTVVEDVSGQKTTLWVVWQNGPWQYRVTGPGTATLDLAMSLLPVSVPQ